jgi:hypothetical protein
VPIRPKAPAFTSLPVILEEDVVQYLAMASSEQRWRILSRVALATHNQPVLVRKTLELVYATDESPELEPVCVDAPSLAPAPSAAAARWRNAVVVPPAPSPAPRPSGPPSPPPSITPTDRAEQLFDAMQALEEGWS